MKRRELIQSIATLPALAFPSVSFAQETKSEISTAPETPVLQMTDSDAVGQTVLHTFTPRQFVVLQRLCDLIAPSASDTPGAKEAGAAAFLDFLLGVSPEDRVSLYRAGLGQLDAEAQHRFKRGFDEITAAQADELLAPLRSAFVYRLTPGTLAAFLSTAKQDILTATFNSREYISVVSRRRRSAGGSGLYWEKVD